MSFRDDQHAFPEKSIKRAEGRREEGMPEETMASSRKAEPEKNKSEGKTKKSSKGNNRTKRRKDDKNKNSNGGVNDGEVPATPSSSSDSQHGVENGVEISQKSTTGGKNSKLKAKRDRREEKQEKEDANMNRFPMERVKRIIRSEDSDMRISNEAVFLVNKATEKFLETFCEEAYTCCVQDRKKSLGYKHLSSVVSKWKRHDFLSDFLPEKVKAEVALAERKLMESGTA